MAKSRKKLFLLVPIVIVVLWAAVGVVDFSRVHSHKLPVFCRWTMRYLDGGSGTYTGLGYSFEIEGDFIGEEPLGVTKYEAKLFGVSVMSGERDK